MYRSISIMIMLNACCKGASPGGLQDLTVRVEILLLPINCTPSASLCLITTVCTMGLSDSFCEVKWDRYA